MTKPMLLADFIRLPPTMRATAFDGVSGVSDKVAEAAPASHRFLRYQWYAAATAAYGLRARTLVVERDGDPVIALPIAQAEPRWQRLAMVPGSYWPFRGFPARADAEDTAFDVLLDRLAIEVNGLRMGPSYDGDPITSAVLAAQEEPLPRKASGRAWRSRLAVPVWRRAGRRRVRPTRRDRGEELGCRSHRRPRRQVHAHRPWRVLAPGDGRPGPRRLDGSGVIDGRRRTRSVLVRPQCRDAQICDRQRLRPGVRQTFAGQIALLSQPRPRTRRWDDARRLGRGRQRLQARDRRGARTGDPRLAVAASRRSGAGRADAARCMAAVGTQACA